MACMEQVISRMTMDRVIIIFQAVAHNWDIDNGCYGHYCLLPNDDAMAED
jgi:hypothetical protein